MAALLDNGDQQILELFKDTLPSRLYYMLYHIDNSREAVEMAKRILAKEQMDKKAGQSSTRKLRNLIYEYKGPFSLRDEIGMYPNIKVEIDVTDNSPFVIRPFHAKEEDKPILDKEMKRLCYLGILKEGFSAYSSPVMLISQKVT